MERVFLAFNKIDALSELQLSQLKEYILNTLKKYDVVKYLPTEPAYISSEKSFDNRISNNATADTVGELENVVWTYLLSQNKTGLHRLIDSCSKSLQLFEKFRNILNARVLNAEKRLQTETEIQYVKKELDSFIEIVYAHRNKIYQAADQHVQNSFNNIIKYLENSLRETPIGNKLPENKNIATWLENNAQKTISEIYTYQQQEISKLQMEINQWVNEKLKQIGLKIDVSNSKMSLQEGQITATQLLQYFENNTSPYRGVMENVFYGVGIVIVSFFSAIEELFTSNKKLRNKQIASIVARSSDGYKNIETNFLLNFHHHLNTITEDIKIKSLDRTDVYLGELSSQLEKFETPISNIEKLNYERFLAEIGQIELKIGSNLNHLKAYTYGID
ncbi:hypothetical protein CJD36_004500 [Flavipsychrobacter stenotrophus]|uniref:Uncharacterized protein n=2 Tax=Flavipsychrobacter stenotrophus TaxID=2077091 RepID=A0A2S7T1C8_9BACT|nr:hypothetical protein CJD36_004500 [Flavipsychrobacter stenotrophus]